MLRFTVLFLLSLTICVLSCKDGHGAGDAAVESGMKRIPEVAEMNRLFPNTTNYISYQSGEYGTPSWNSVIGLFKRYELTLQTEITLSKNGSSVEKWGDIHIYLREVGQITEDARGVQSISYGTIDKELTAEEWKKVVDHDGKFETIGVNLERDKPVPGWDKYAATQNYK